MKYKLRLKKKNILFPTKFLQWKFQIQTNKNGLTFINDYLI